MVPFLPRRVPAALLATTLLLAPLGSVPSAVAQVGNHESTMSEQDQQTLHRALDAYDSGDAKTARPLLRKLNQSYPESYPAAEALGSLYAEAGDLDAALPLLRRATALAPGESLAFANLGAAYLKLSRAPEAARELRRAVALDPRNAASQTNLGQALVLAGEPKAAVRAFAAAAAADPENAKVRYAWALALYNSNAPAESAAVLKQIPSAAWTDGMHALAGDANERAGNFPQAIAEFEAAAKQNPSEDNLYALTAELMRHWNWKEAIEVADYGSRRFPNATRFRIAAGASLYGESEFKAAVQVFSALLAADPANSVEADLLGRSCAALADGQFTGCEGVYEYAERHPGNPVMTTYAAIALLHAPDDAGTLAKAETLLRSAIAHNPNYAEAYMRLGALQQARQQWAESAVSLERAIALDPSSAEAHYRLSRAYAHLGRREEAQQQNALRQSCEDKAKASMNARMQEVVRFVLTPG